jgi:flagellar biosynthesis/type III secretory pathway M-ring protein FliF/YscJ
MTSQDLTVLGIKLVFALLGLAATVAFVVLPIWRMLRRTEDVELVLKPFEPRPEEELQIPVDDLNRGRKLDRKELLEELRADPTRTAQVMKDWLREKNRPGGRPPPPKGS